MIILHVTCGNHEEHSGVSREAPRLRAEAHGVLFLLKRERAAR